MQTETELSSLAQDCENEAERLVSGSARYVRFGPFQIDHYRQEVTRDGVRIRIKGKVFHALVALVEKPGQIVTREELRNHLWPGDRDVNYDANVNTTVNKLRQALGDSSSKPAYIETIPRKGYSFIGQPLFSDKPAERSSLAVTRTATPTEVDPSPQPPRSWKIEHWIGIGAIVLLIAGMLLGAGIMRIWMAHRSGRVHETGARSALYSPALRRVNTSPFVRPASSANS